MKTFEKKNVILTGAATGIGRLMALMLSEEKANLALIDIDRGRLEQTLEEVAANGVKARAYVCDISNKKNIDRIMKRINSDFDRIDVLINNAGIVAGKLVKDLEFDDIDRTIKVNFVGGAYLTKLVLPDMMKRDSGHICNIASAMGLTGVPRMGEYVASKFAIVGFTDTLRMELKKYGYKGIKTLVVCPSGIDTGMFAGYKAPIMSPLLKPEKVARKTLLAIRKNKTYLKLPLIVKFIPSMKLFPAGTQDIMARMTGLLSSMDHFKNKERRF